jgi:hypothetical protein
MEAAKYGHHTIVQYLVSVGADTTPTVIIPILCVIFSSLLIVLMHA